MLDRNCRGLVPLTGMMRRWAWRLNHRMAHWPLSPPWWWCRRPVWVAMGLAVWAGEVLTPAALHLMPLSLVPVLLAAWCGDFIWSLGLALGLPWGACLSWWWQGAPWALRVEVVNALGQTVAMVVTVVLMTALQRHAVRLALERDPGLLPE